MNMCSHCWYCLYLSVCHLLSYVCVCVCVCLSPAWHFFLLLLPNNRWCLHVLPVLSSPISSQRAVQHAAVPFKEIVQNILLSHPRGETVRVQAPLETGNHQHSLIFLNSMSKGCICDTAEGTTVVLIIFKNWCFSFALLLIPTAEAECWVLPGMSDRTEQLDTIIILKVN